MDDLEAWILELKVKGQFMPKITNRLQWMWILSRDAIVPNSRSRPVSNLRTQWSRGCNENINSRMDVRVATSANVQDRLC